MHEVFCYICISTNMRISMEQEIKTPKVRLLADRLLVSVEKAEEQVTASGIILPATKESDTNSTIIGNVILVSSKITNCEVEEDKVYQGEQVMFSKYAGTDLEHEGKQYKIIRITDVIGALE